MSKKLSFEEPSLFSWENGSSFVSNPAPFAGQELGTFAASCTIEAALKKSGLRCMPSKCPHHLVTCF